MLKVFIGYDKEEPQAFSTLAHSIYTRASKPVAIHPLVIGGLKHVYTRQRGPTESTEFSLSRFLVPYLCDYADERVLFMDCDMLCTVDIYSILKEIDDDPHKAVWCVQHNYIPKSDKKFLNQVQTKYPCKNWSSMMVMNPASCRALTPSYVNHASGLDLHRFRWLDNSLIGSLPLEWNWLVGEYPANPQAKILHYTLGGPWFAPYKTGDHVKEWFAEHKEIV